LSITLIKGKPDSIRSSPPVLSVQVWHIAVKWFVDSLNLYDEN